MRAKIERGLFIAGTGSGNQRTDAVSLASSIIVCLLIDGFWTSASSPASTITPSTISKMAKTGISNGKLQDCPCQFQPAPYQARMPSVTEKPLVGRPLVNGLRSSRAGSNRSRSSPTPARQGWDQLGEAPPDEQGTPGYRFEIPVEYLVWFHSFLQFLVFYLYDLRIAKPGSSGLASFKTPHERRLIG